MSEYHSLYILSLSLSKTQRKAQKATLTSSPIDSPSIA